MIGVIFVELVKGSSLMMNGMHLFLFDEVLIAVSNGVLFLLFFRLLFGLL